jgi:hypothetical protein
MIYGGSVVMKRVSQRELSKAAMIRLASKALGLVPGLVSSLCRLGFLPCQMVGQISQLVSSSGVPFATRLEYSGYRVGLHQNTAAVTTSIFLGIESLAVVTDFFTTLLFTACPDKLELRAIVVCSCDLDADLAEGFLACFAPFLETRSV